MLKTTFLPFPTTKSSFLTQHKKLRVLSEKSAGLKQNPSSRGNGPAVGGGNIQESRAAGRDPGAGDAMMWQDAPPAKCMALQLGAADGLGGGGSDSAQLHPYPSEFYVQPHSWPGRGTGGGLRQLGT